MHENEVAREVVDSALRVHSALGPGLLESVYEKAPAFELRRRGIEVLQQHPIPIVYESVRFEDGFRADLLVGRKVIVELKSIEEIAPVHKKQLLTYLKLSGLHLGLLINFNVVLIKDGIVRLVPHLPE